MSKGVIILYHRQHLRAKISMLRYGAPPAGLARPTPPPRQADAP